MKIAPKEKANLVCIWKNEEEKPQTGACMIEKMEAINHTKKQEANGSRIKGL